MELFELEESQLINLESIDYVVFKQLEGQKTVVVGLHGHSFVVPLSRHKEFFSELTKLGAMPNKQFVSV